MIKTLLLASAATALLAGAASAPAPVFPWTGAYFGINAGYAFDASSNNTSSFAVPAPYGNGTTAFFSQRNQEGFTGGGQVGYNYQFTPGSGVVIGIEADAQYVDFRRNPNRFLLTPAFAPA